MLKVKKIKANNLSLIHIYVVIKGLFGLQDLLFVLIHGLIWALPLGIIAFAAQLSAQFSACLLYTSRCV